MIRKNYVVCAIVFVFLFLAGCVISQPHRGDGSYGSASSGVKRGMLKVASGQYHNLLSVGDGVVRAWGRNVSGQLGDGTHTDKSVLVKVQALTDVVDIAAGDEHSLALKADGTLWAWGSNEKGQLGLGMSGPGSTKPMQITALAGIVAIAGAGEHSMALKSDGTVFEWGENRADDSERRQENTPVRLTGLPAVVAIADGPDYSMAIGEDKSLWMWGANWAGQLGDGSTEDSVYPARVPGLDNVVAVAAGGYHSIVLQADGMVWTTGFDEHGQLGEGADPSGHQFSKVAGLSDIKAIAGGEGHSIALKNDGTLWVWGWNEDGQLGGDVKGMSSPAAMRVQGISEVTAISAGALHTVAACANGELWAWGANKYGQLGNGANLDGFYPVKNSPVPVRIKAGS